MPEPELYAGLRSSRHPDRLDAALVDFSGPSLRIVETLRAEHPSTPLDAEEAATDPTTDFPADRVQFHADALSGLIARAGVSPAAVRAAGYQGQSGASNRETGTRHALDAAMLARITAITVICDFRGGTPDTGDRGLAPDAAFHHAVFRSGTRHRVVLSIDHVARITDLAPGLPARCFEAGPGTALMDAWIRRQRGTPADLDGVWAASGRSLEDLVERLSAYPLGDTTAPKRFRRDPPDLAWLESQLAGTEAPEDIQASLLEATARGIANAIVAHCDGRPTELLVCGDGARNLALLATLTGRLPGVTVKLTDSFGIRSESVDAVALAWLAHQTLKGPPDDSGGVVHPRKPRILGVIYPP